MLLLPSDPNNVAIRDGFIKARESLEAIDRVPHTTARCGVNGEDTADIWMLPGQLRRVRELLGSVVRKEGRGAWAQLADYELGRDADVHRDKTFATTPDTKTITPEMKKRSEAFKAEGNSAFSLKQYTVALAKYTEAIAQDPTNAVLYSNRSACYLHMKRWELALQDATKAVDLNPTFVKAMIRRASALTGLQRSVDAMNVYDEVLKLEPDHKVAKEERAKLREQRAAAAKGNISSTSKENHPYYTLKKQYEGKLGPAPHSAASRLLLAGKSYMEGMEAVASLVPLGHPSENKWYAMSGGLEDLTNALIRNADCLVLEHDTLDKIKKYMFWEMTVRQSINVTETTPAKAIAEYEKRLKANGWDDVRRGLTLSVRALIFSGVLQHKLGSTGDAVNLLRKAVQLLDLAKTHLLRIQPVGYERCGVVLKHTFVRSVKLQLIQAILNGAAHTKHSSVFDIEEAKKLLDEILESLESTPSAEQPVLGNPDYFDFYLYHYALYHYNYGFYHMIKAQKGETVVRTSADGKTVALMMDPREAKRAMTSYLSAVPYSPPDDLIAANCCIKVVELGCKIGVLSKGQIWDLWAQSQKIISANTWYQSIFPTDFAQNPAYTFVQSVIYSNGGKEGFDEERDVRLPPMVDIISKTNNRKDVNDMMAEILKDHEGIGGMSVGGADGGVFDASKERWASFEANVTDDLD
ncbi:hypothetical protein HK104_009330 [Borealophlyctis nickersoniae]|nr:hypothetical protein HK104_009330 [Borealophlyctis nickersoniae]